MTSPPLQPRSSPDPGRPTAARQDLAPQVNVGNAATWRTLVALATYNEIGNLPALVDEIERHLPFADLVVVDDNSPDGTGQWCDKRAKSDERFRVIHREGKAGLGSATLAAMRYAVDAQYDRLITMDADFSHAPQHLSALQDAAADAAVVIGSRYCRGGRIDGWPWTRRLASRLINATSRSLLRLTPRDCSGAFRCYSVSCLAKLDLHDIQAQGYAYLEEILWQLQKRGASICEVPIVFAPRRRGESKLNAGEAWEKISTIWRLFRQRGPIAGS